ncbi:SPOR domain-containing protein [Variovorax sp. PCZ-1]|uniref:SPOR domain-containing protein n=1 Tax=Variovorax sp. PCZ-1 TaxID=2835533 RepID=UPI001BD16DEB|nr:SPOR domain-containing protein [Variovorax sp. PCZ-1]MBS7806557.1 SPOR domain-containing protein [Variovorax sp. PCZ-1]
MAWFKFGKQDSAAVQDSPVETVETMRTRAKRRLIGALVLVVAAVVGFPLLFQTQPRPALVDVPIEIPDKATAKPLAAPPAQPSTPAAAAKVDDKASLGGKEEIVSAAPAVAPKSNEKPPVAGVNTAPSATKTVVNTPPAAPDKSAEIKAAAEKAAADKAAADKAAAQKAAQDKSAQEKLVQEKIAQDKAKAEALAKSKADAAKAQALLDGKAAAAAPAAEGRFIVQFGSFAEESKAREVRQKVERAGLKTYAQIAETSEGKRHRARVGPFATRAEAEKAAAKIKALDLPANILTL